MSTVPTTLSTCNTFIMVHMAWKAMCTMIKVLHVDRALPFFDWHQHRHKSLAWSVIGRLVAEVRIVQVGVVASSLHERLVVALFDDAPAIQDDDAVGMADG